MDNPETLATLGKQENGTQTNTHTLDQKNIKWAKRTCQKSDGERRFSRRV